MAALIKLVISVVTVSLLMLFFAVFRRQYLFGNTDPFFRNASQLTNDDIQDLNTFVNILHDKTNEINILHEDNIIEEKRRRLSESSWDKEMEEVLNEKWMQQNNHKNKKSFSGPGHYNCPNNHASSCQISQLSSTEDCRIDILVLHSLSSWKNMLPSKCVLNCPTDCIFFPSEQGDGNDFKTEDSSERYLVRKRRKKPQNDKGLNIVVETKPLSSRASVTGFIETPKPLANADLKSGVFWIGPGNYVCENVEDEDQCVSMSEQCKIDIMDWDMLQYFSEKELVGSDKKSSRRIPNGCMLQCPNTCTFMQPQPHEEIDTSNEQENYAINPRAFDKNCIENDDSGDLPCPNIDIWNKCDKFNGGDFLSCFRACKASFCCIHDSKSVNYSPSCSSNSHCPFYSPCYIVWWYLHDSIGPATFANFQWYRQKEPFYENSFNVTEWRKELNESPNFFAQFYGHHFDKESRPTDEEVQDPNNW